jgi:hypothetical protein
MQENDYNNRSAKKINHKSFSYPFIIALVIICIVIGFILYNLFSFDNSLSKFGFKNNSQLHSYKDTGYNYQFINPYRQSTAFEKIFTGKLVNIDNLVNDYCFLSMKDKNIQQISMYFKDLTNDHWFGVKENDIIIPANHCNILLLMAAYHKSEKDNGYLNKTIIYKVTKSSDKITTSLKIGTPYTVENLIKLIATRSDAGAFNILLNDIGTDSLESLQKQIGFKDTKNAVNFTNYFSLKEYASFFQVLYNVSLLNNKNSQQLLALLSQNEFDKGIRSAAFKNIKISHEFTEIDTLVEYVKGKSFVMYHGGIVYYPGKPYLICIYIKGTSRTEMEKSIFNIAKIVFKEVDIQVRTLHLPNIDDDIN